MEFGKMWLALVVIMATLTSHVSGKRPRCRSERHEYYNEHLGCATCEKCPPGMQPNFDLEVKIDPDNGALSCPPCQICPQGTYNPDRNYDLCRTCRKCDSLSRHTDLSCSPTSNAVCKHCLPGYHDVYKSLSNSADSTKPCQSCEISQKDAPECQHLTKLTNTTLTSAVTSEVTRESRPRQQTKGGTTTNEKHRTRSGPITKAKCLSENHQYYNEHLGCATCEKCPPGMQPNFDVEVKTDPDNGALSCPPCQICPQGTYNPDRNYDLCRTCRRCDSLSRHTDLSCSPTTNAVCKDCLPGYHDVYKSLSNSADSTKPCQSCEISHKDAPECLHLTQLTNTTLTSQVTRESRPGHETKGRTTTNEKGVTRNGPITSEGSYVYVMGALIAVVILMGVLFGAYVLKKKVCPPEKHTVLPMTDTECNVRMKTPPSHQGRFVDHGAQNVSYTGSSDAIMTEPLLSPEVVCDGPGASLSPEVVCDGPGPLVSPEVVCDGPDPGNPRENAVVTVQDFRLIQRRIGKQWKDLARGLRISESDIEKLEIDHSETAERIYQLLLLWTRQNRDGALVGSLCSVLRSLGRHDVALEVLQDKSLTS